MEEAMHPHAYRLLTDSPAKKKAKKLVEVVELMGFDLKLSRAQELVAGLMGYADWAELLRVTRDAPERGVPDQMLPPKAATTRRKRQRALLADEFGIDDSDAGGILAALAPTGEAEGLTWPSAEKLGLRLAEEDVAWLDASMELVREFDAAVRPLYRMSPAPASAMDPRGVHGLTHVRVEITLPGRRKRVVRNTAPSDIVGWVASGFPAEAPLAGEMLAEVTARAETACRVFAELDGRIRALGEAPMLAPIDWTFLMLYRARVSGDASHYTALCPEPWLHIGFDLPGFCFNPENEWNASRALAIQLGLRREFIDSGWTGDGPEWRVTFREGNSAKEEMVVRADTAAAACSWVAAARAALRLAKRQLVGIFSLLSVVGPDGAVDINQALKAAVAEPVVKRGKLLGPDRLRARARRTAA
jgi:hypothetical protein